MRSAKLAVVASVGLAGLLVLGGCGALADRGSAAGQGASDSVEVPDTLSAEGVALAAIGVDQADLATETTAETEDVVLADGASPVPSAAASPGGGAKANLPRRHRLRVLLRHHTLHGEIVVQTKQGTRTVAVQRGTVTAVTGTGFTVKSPDGFTQTWTFGDPIRVVQNRARADRSAIKVGEQVGVGGLKQDGGYAARLVVIPMRQPAATPTQ